jgi:pyridoxal phosphate enzyme (YggS family)
VSLGIRERLRSIKNRIARACESVGRDPASVTLVAVTKTQPLEAIQEAYDLGLRDFGESRLQEARPKIEKMSKDVRWHFIGTLQSNKVRAVTSRFDVVHTICTESQLAQLQKSERRVDGLIEVNIAHETQKSGIEPKFLEHFGKLLLSCSQVRFRGLMTIGPPVDDPEAMRLYFRELRDLNQNMGGDWLSMGMSHDFEVAIQEGSTHVRIGTALFGERHNG